MPRTFKCDIKQRTQAHREVIFQALEDSKSVLKKYEY